MKKIIWGTIIVLFAAICILGYCMYAMFVFSRNVRDFEAEQEKEKEPGTVEYIPPVLHSNGMSHAKATEVPKGPKSEG